MGGGGGGGGGGRRLRGVGGHTHTTGDVHMSSMRTSGGNASGVDREALYVIADGTMSAL